jgi:hypothetical protein
LLILFYFYILDGFSLAFKFAGDNDSAFTISGYTRL